jgi:hypothetical protein
MAMGRFVLQDNRLVGKDNAVTDGSLMIGVGAPRPKT